MTDARTEWVTPRLKMEGENVFDDMHWYCYYDRNLDLQVVELDTSGGWLSTDQEKNIFFDLGYVAHLDFREYPQRYEDFALWQLELRQESENLEAKEKEKSAEMDKANRMILFSARAVFAYPEEQVQPLLDILNGIGPRLTQAAVLSALDDALDADQSAKVKPIGV